MGTHSIPGFFGTKERDLSAEGWRQRQQQQEEVPRELKIRDTIPLPPNIVTQKTAPPGKKGRSLEIQCRGEGV